MSGYSDDTETYLRMCKYYKVDVQYKDNNLPDVYGHGMELWKRLKEERKNKPWRQLEEWETYDNNKETI